MEQTTVEGGRKQVWANRFQWPLALAVILLMAAQWIPAAKGTRLTSIVLLMILIPPVAAEAGPAREGYQAYRNGQYDQALKKFIDGQLQDPDNPELLYNIGNAYYKSGDFSAAEDHYRQSLETADPGLKPKLLYNLGNTAYRQGKLQEAVEKYQAALDLAPEDAQARENMNFVKKQLEQQQQPQNQQDQQQDEQNQSQEQQNQNPSSPDNQDQPDDQQQNQAQSQQNQQQDQQPPPQYGAQDNEQQKEQTAAGESKPEPGRQQAPSAADQALRRLKDEPGRALMPNYRKRRVEKDW
jgi:Ca-activated chloride channel family protein